MKVEEGVVLEWALDLFPDSPSSCGRGRGAQKLENDSALNKTR